MEERILCPVCSWEGDSEICPQCGFPISKFRHLLRGEPELYDYDEELYDEDVRTEFEAEVQKYRAAYEEKRLTLLRYLIALLGQLAQKKANEGFGVQEQQLSLPISLPTTVTSFPLPTLQQLTLLRQLAAELNDNVARVVAVLKGKKGEHDERLKRERTAALELEKSVSDRWRSAFHGFQGGSAERGSDLVQLIKELGGADSEVAGLVDQVNSCRARRPIVQKALWNAPVEQRDAGEGWGCLTGLVLFGLLLVFGFGGCVVGCLLAPLAGYGVYRWVAYVRPRNRREALEKELKFLEDVEKEALQQIEQQFNTALNAVKADREGRISALEERLRTEYAEFKNQTLQSFQDWFRGWKERVNRLREEMGRWGAGWREWQSEQWVPVSEPLAFLRLGEWRRTIEIGPLRETVSLPALVPFRGAAGLFRSASGASREAVIRSFQSLGFRLLASVPPGKLRFTFIDPVGLGQNVAPLLHLKEFDESDEDSLVTSRAWVDAEHIRRQLKSLKEHIATVVQERLRDQYPNIEAYNREAGEVAVPYRVLMVLDFPANFSDEAAQDLLAIARTGSQVGVFTIVHCDPGRKLPYDFKVEELAQSLRVAEWDVFNEWSLVLDEPPPQELRNVLIQKWGAEAKEGMKVEVPFAKLLQLSDLDSDPKWWRASAADVVEVPLGLVTARKVQHLVLGKGTWNHALIVGRTGSGKSNLMHIIVTTAALKYAPEELRMYLVDLKTVEFAVYRELPHAEAVAVDADREFALSIIEGLDQEMLKRMEAFRGIANDLAEYREKTGQTMPRILLLVDEFQVLFEQDDQVAEKAGRLLDRLVRQGRAFGIHVLLGSQSLAGHLLPRSTLDQMAVRIALQCSEADSRLVLAEDNPAARRLSRPGQAIYNSANGLIEGNTEFQVALFSDRDREEYVRLIAEKSDRRPLVFEGNKPARLEDCAPLKARLQAGPLSSVRLVESWIGEPVAIRPPVAVRWSRRSGNHLLVVTREEEEGVGVLMSAVVSLCVQYPAQRLRVYIADFSTPEAEWAEISEVLQATFPEQIQVLGRRELLRTLTELQEMVRRFVEEGSVIREDHYLVLVGVHRIRDLRLSDDLGFRLGEEMSLHPSEQLAAILRDGPEAGIHVLMWCDTVGNLQRYVDRRALREIGLRVAGPMSEEDSMHLIDSPAAARLDKPHRMVFYDDERPGMLEKFRPYVVRDLAWLQNAGKI
jgi:ABC-type multidrug transport system fused ATPase/permease subunit